MNILYIGTQTSYVTQNDLELLEDRGHNVVILNPYPIPSNPSVELVQSDQVVNLYDQKHLPFLRAPMGETLGLFILSALRRRAETIRRIAREHQIDLVYATWGPNGIPIVKVVQETRPRTPIVYSFLSYPQNVFRWKVALENWYCRRPIENLEGRIHATSNMYSYMDDHFNLKKYGLDIVMTPFFSRKYFYNRRLALLSETDGAPHLVFIGPMKLPWDDIREEIYGITKEKIHVHLAKVGVPINRSPYLHFFEYFSLSRLIDGSFATFMTQFDACIVLFNFKVCSNRDRFYTSLPSRFLFALNAGIPIALPRNCLTACEEFVNKHQIGFAYENFAHLREMLSDENLMKRYRSSAMNKRNDFTYEKNFHILDRLIREVRS